MIHAPICLDYCNSLLYNLPKGSIERLQKIQNQASLIVTKTPRCDHISEVIASLHLWGIEQNIIYKITILNFIAFVDDSAPVYLSELVKEKNSSRNKRSANDDILLEIPQASRNCYHTFFGSNHSTDMCIFTVKSLIKYYTRQNGPVYTCFLDASKAFDRINHWTLFKKLIDCNVPLLIVKIFVFLVSNATSLCQVGQISFSVLFNSEWCTTEWYPIFKNCLP